MIIQTLYPSLGDDDFRDRLVERSDYQLFKSIKQPMLTRDEFDRLSKEQCSGFEKTMYQHLMQHYLSIRSPYRSLLLLHNLGTGKCHAKDTPIIMYDGTIKMVQDIQVGDLLMGDDSTPRRVLSLATGYDDMYDVVPVKGDKYTVNSEHILCLKPSPFGVSYIKKRGVYAVTYYQSNGKVTSKSFKTEAEARAFRNGIYINNPVIEIPIKDYINLSKMSRGNLKGYRTGVNFPEQPLPIDPHLFGIWLGDGGSRDPKITTADPEILDFVKKEIEKMGLRLHYESRYDYRILSTSTKKYTNTFYNFMKDYNLINNKHIPHIFLANSRENRLKLLAGLIDIDGHYDNGGYEITQKSDKIADGILYLARSLGFAAYNKKCEKSCMYKGERKAGIYNRIFISGDLCEIPVLLPHKKACERKQIKNVLVTGIDVQHVGRGKYYGFTLDGNNRYLLGDFTVTHNTCSSITVAEAFLKDHREGDEPSIIVVSTGTLHKSYEGQIFSISQKASLEALREQCTGDYYMRLVGKLKVPTTDKQKDALQREIDAKIKQRYEFVTYQKFANKLIQLDKDGKLNTIRDKVIIIDEAHNLRETAKDPQQQKALTQPLIKMLRQGQNNRLMLLSATPMYNEPDEILWLLSLLCINDKRKLKGKDIIDPDHLPVLFKNGILDPDAKKLLQQLSSSYISYIRGNNPFTFPIRVSPRSMGVRMLESSITDDEMTDPTWPSYYKDGLVPTPLGIHQVELVKKATVKSQEAHAQLKIQEQINCIAYNGKTGKACLQDLFEINISPTMSFKYRGSIPWLSPTEDMLGSIASKMLRICEFVRTSTGIIVIYSSHNWSGIIPLAIALEHVGFSRYGGTKMLHRVPVSKKHPRPAPYTYDDVPNAQYVMLSGNQDIMKGGKSITELLEDINDPSNINGEKVKVVLITPIAREGLTIKNAREMHVLTPWYNINNLEQVIGRTIRTCSHIGKPIEERNVTVYLHAAVANDPKTGTPIDTADIHSYRISARKLNQINEIINLIRDNAWDCSLMKNINYMPKSTFDFNIDMKTSQNTVIHNYSYGDDPEDMPRCPDIAQDAKSKQKTDKIRPDVYEDIIPTIQARLRKYIKASKMPMIVPMSELPGILRMSDFPEVVQATVEASLEKDGLLPKHRVFIHRDSLYIVENPSKKKGVQVSIQVEQEEEKATVEEQLNVFDYISNIQDDDEAVIFVYDTLYADMWPILADKIIHTRESAMAPWMSRIAKLLHREGALIESKEYPSLSTNLKYIGYYDFFKENSPMYILGRSGNIALANKTEINAIQAKRRAKSMPETGIAPDRDYGVYVPYKSKKDPNIHMIFKIWKKGVEIKKVNPGIACQSMYAGELEELWKSLGIPETTLPKAKQARCDGIKSVMLKKKRLFLPPMYKPS